MDNDLAVQVDQAHAEFDRYAVALAWSFVSAVDSHRVEPNNYEMEIVAKFRAADRLWGELLIRWCDEG